MPSCLTQTTPSLGMATVSAILATVQKVTIATVRSWRRVQSGELYHFERISDKKIGRMPLLCFGAVARKCLADLASILVGMWSLSGGRLANERRRLIAFLAESTLVFAAGFCLWICAR